MKYTLSLISLLLLLSITLLISINADDDIVNISSGSILGVRDYSQNIRYWKGVPYAGSVSGEQRFTAPVAPQSWASTLNCTQFGPGCISTHHNADTAPIQSEDCLNLNIYVPLNESLSASSSLPVMFFMYGGGFAEGDNQGPFGMYDGTFMASQYQVIVVTVNYRLGAFGYLVTDELNGNFGFLDQQFAMKWVQENIAVFGGDKNKVTIWGESAGAMSVGLHLVSPSSQGLFSAAIMESNPTGMLYKNMTGARVYGSDFCQVLQCQNSNQHCDSACLRSKSPQDITFAWQNTSDNVWVYVLANLKHLTDGFLDYAPVIDGNLIPSEVIPLLENGKYATNIPLLVGINTNEGATFIYEMDKPISMLDFYLAIDVVFGSDSTKINHYYSQMNYTDGRQAFSQWMTDFWFTCASQKFVTATRKAGTNAYFYRYNHVISQADVFQQFGLPSICASEVCHASELPFVFHLMEVHDPNLNLTLTAQEYALSQTIIQYWTNFAKFGNPNGNSSLSSPLTSSPSSATIMNWPIWDVNTRSMMVLDENQFIDETVQLCTFWDQIGYNF